MNIMPLGLQKELAAARDRIEMLEQENKKLELQLIYASDHVQNNQGNEGKQPKSQQLDFRNEEKIPLRIELLVEKHLNYGRLVDFVQQSDIHIASEIGISHLMDVTEMLNNLQKFSWEMMGEYLQVTLSQEYFR